MGTNGVDRLEGFTGLAITEGMLELLIGEHRRRRVPRLELLWRYFRNPLEAATPGGEIDPLRGARLRCGQEVGLPDRLRGLTPEGEAGLIDPRARPRREVVIENDIGWRVETLIDFMFGRPVRVVSTAEGASRREAIGRVLEAVWEASGGIGLLQDAALLGHVFGYVDLVLRVDEAGLTGGRARFRRALEGASGEELAGLIRIELVDPRRGIPIQNPDDYRRLDGYAVLIDRELNEVEGRASAGAYGAYAGEDRAAGGAGAAGPRRRLWRGGGVGGRGPKSEAPGLRRRSTVLEVIGPGRRRVFEGGKLVLEERSALLGGVVPVVHVQNLSQPYSYEGLSEVEPLIPLQDELNTRLSDRASRVAMQSFKMYLAKRLDGFEAVPVGPGVVWSTDDPEAEIQAFGGDAESPSESEHIEQVREAMDKVSAVPPLAGGVLRARIGNLSSAAALRITLMSLLAKTARKRVTYGRGIERMSRLVLSALNAAGVFETTGAERGVRVVWPEAQQSDPRDEVEAGLAKVELGVPRSRVLEELGYGTGDAGVV